MPRKITHERLLQAKRVCTTDYKDYGGSVERWKDGDNYPDCSWGCKWAAWLGGSRGSDWCVCAKPGAPREGYLTFEHQAGFGCFEHMEGKGMSERTCTCHPEEAPVPCQRRYALSECKAAAERAKPAASDRRCLTPEEQRIMDKALLASGKIIARGYSEEEIEAIKAEARREGGIAQWEADIKALRDFGGRLSEAEYAANWLAANRPLPDNT